LRSPQELLQLKICDMAMGSGVFLVQTCRYLAERLVEAWQQEALMLQGDLSLMQSNALLMQSNASTMQSNTLPTKGDTLPMQDSAFDTATVRVLPDGGLSLGELGETLLPKDLEEQAIVARRLIADRCLYGVDKNPLAVEMAKLSLWLITLAKSRPFTFLDHALK
jgi:hypothetical protein